MIKRLPIGLNVVLLVGIWWGAIGCGSADERADGAAASVAPEVEALYLGTSVEEANTYLDFRLIAPVVPSFELVSILVHEQATSSQASAATVEYEEIGVPSGNSVVRVYETSETVELPSPGKMQTAALGGIAEPSTVSLPPSQREEVTIAGYTVTQTVIYAPDGVPIETYSLVLDGIHIDITNSSSTVIAGETVPAFVAAWLSSI